MDTICIPVSETYDERKKRAKKKAIAQMAGIYQSSASVLVLDAWLQTFAVSGSLPDKVARLYVSNWIHRLWTVQESVLSSTVYVQFSGGAQLMDHIRKPCQAYTPGNQIGEAWSRYTRFPQVMEEQVLSFISALRFLMGNLPRPAENHDAGRLLDICHLSRALEHRATSHLKDETICVSTLLKLDTVKLLNISGRDADETAEKRMEEMWRQVGCVPKGIIFHHGPRLQRKGFRWAPLTFMGARPGHIMRDFTVAGAPFHGSGIEVNYPGFIMADTVGPPAKGVLSISLQSSPSVCYHLELFPEKANAYPEWHGPAQCAVILLEQISVGSGTTEAILGIVQGDRPGKDTISILFQTRLLAKALASSGKENTQGLARLLKNTQRWHVC